MAGVAHMEGLKTQFHVQRTVEERAEKMKALTACPGDKPYYSPITKKEIRWVCGGLLVVVASSVR